MLLPDLQCTKCQYYCLHLQFLPVQSITVASLQMSWPSFVPHNWLFCSVIVKPTEPGGLSCYEFVPWEVLVLKVDPLSSFYQSFVYEKCSISNCWNSTSLQYKRHSFMEAFNSNYWLLYSLGNGEWSALFWRSIYWVPKMARGNRMLEFRQQKRICYKWWLGPPSDVAKTVPAFQNRYTIWNEALDKY